MKLHVLGVPHTVTSKSFSTCAFTQKVVNLCAMMTRRGHEVIHYGVEGSEVEASESVAIISHAEWAAHYSKPTTGFYDISMDGDRAPYIKLYADRLRDSLSSRTSKSEPFTEIICCTWNGPQVDGSNGIQQFRVETGIGYEHAWSDYRVYESYAWLHMQLGKHWLQQGGKWYWTVIPNAFDVKDFLFDRRPGKTPDFLFMGRLNDDKGVGLAIDICKRIGRKITIVGQGNPERFLQGNPHVTYLEPVAGRARADLLASAAAVFTPSIYVEPFCGVHVEAMLCGTPVITTDWGVFPETVLHGVTGYRCRTVEQMMFAAQNLDRLASSDVIRQYAAYNYSTDRVALMYEEYFQSVLNLKYPKGFYTENPARKQLDFLKRSTPVQPPVDLHVELVIPEPPVEKKGWAVDQDWERDWWGLHWAPHWDDEIRKQQTYFRLMGLRGNGEDFENDSILDIGCGPVSMLQRTTQGLSRGVDPLAVSDETRERYRKSEVEFLNLKAEEMPTDRQFDQVWIYNCLQHTDSPTEIFRRAIACSKVGAAFHIFEWIDLGVCPGHPQNLTEKMFAEVFTPDLFELPIWNVGFLTGFGGTVTEKYIAIHAIRKR
jgi:glycosyltransferase involved in cell wall biosynthesis